jgi:N-acyl-D-aspartate/D-glutamate deacylase
MRPSVNPNSAANFGRALIPARISRGVLKQGTWADRVVFTPATNRDNATFENPNQLSQGMDFVLVNGIPVIETVSETAR